MQLGQRSSDRDVWLEVGASQHPQQGPLLSGYGGGEVEPEEKVVVG
ncbi:MAG: hypothetical protein QM522_11885 [Chitinophagaceae bacterium]|nr:hypothetical protein [Chitinophagaceae bacterium]